MDLSCSDTQQVCHDFKLLSSASDLTNQSCSSPSLVQEGIARVLFQRCTQNAEVYVQLLGVWLSK